MIEITMCNYPGVLKEVIVQNYYAAPIAIFIVCYIIVLLIADEKSFKANLLYVVCTAFFSVVLLNIVAFSNYISLDASQEDMKVFNQHLTALEKSKFPENDVIWMRNWAQCSIQDGEISGFEFEQLDNRFKKTKEAQEVRDNIKVAENILKTSSK